MRLIDLTCPYCGAQLSVEAETNSVQCEHCGAVLLLDDEAKHIQYDNAEKAGCDFKKGRIRAQSEMNNVTLGSDTVSQKKRRTWLWVLGWVFAFPIPLTILLLRKKEMKPALKYGIIIAVWLLYILFVIAGASNNGSDSRYNNGTNNTPEKTTKPALTEKIVPSDETTTEIISTPEPILVERISINEVDNEIVWGESLELSAVVFPESADDKTITWSSSDNSVIMIDKNGKISAVGAGVAEIVATASNGVSDSIEFTVDGSKRVMSLYVTHKQENDINIGSEWSYYTAINGEQAGRGTYTISVGDTITAYAKFTEFDDNPDVGEATKTHVVTAEDLLNGFIISMDLNVKENGGIYNGKSAKFSVKFSFSPKE